MIVPQWEKLPAGLQLPEVRPYYDSLRSKNVALFMKRLFDIALSFLLLILFSPLFLVLAIAIKLESRGPVFFRQERVTQYGRRFLIYKFRSMVQGAEKKGTQVTMSNDMRITRVGHFIRQYRLDEIPQLINVFQGAMTFVGTRPEVPKYVAGYTPEMIATLLLPAGVTSEASIHYKNEAELLEATDDIDKCYIETVLPGKMEYNLKAIQNFSFWGDIHTMVRTMSAVLCK